MIDADVARFTNVKIEQCQGEIYSLCKDQHGCRYLQKQLESQNPDSVHLIFLETNQHVVELMTGGFSRSPAILGFTDYGDRSVRELPLSKVTRVLER